MKSALITGSSSGIGLEIAKKLLSMGYRVYGVSRREAIYDKNFIHIDIDLRDTNKVKSIRDHIKDNLYIIVNSAGVGHFGPHESLSFNQIEDSISINFTAPILISKIFLRELRESRGYIFNINSISAIQPASHGSLYGATKAALRQFGSSLFKESRKSGLKIININPDITDTPFFNDLEFKPTKDPQTYIEAIDIANLIEHILDQRDGTVITDITIQPQKFQIEKRVK